MATITQRLAFLISANAEQAIKAFDKTAATAEKQMGKAGKSIDKLGAQMTKFGAAGLAATGVIGQQLFKAGQAASDLSESMNKTRVIFGGASKDIESFAETAADKLGLSKRAALDAASTFATFGKAAGLSGTELTGFSKQLVTLSADLASFYNTSPEDAILAIGAALRGESEPIRRYGVLLNDAVLKQEMMALTGKEVTGTLTPQQKVLAAQAAILKQTTDAQGDAIRTGDGLAMTQKRVQATLDNLRAEFGEAAIPVIKAGADATLAAASGFNKLNDATGGAITKFATFGTVGLGVISTASLVAGQLIKLRDRFGQIDEATGKFNGKLTTTGKIISAASVGIGVAALLYADYADTKSKAEAVTRDFADALKAEGEAQKTAVAKLLEGKPGLVAGIDLTAKLGVNFGDLADKTSASSKRLDELSTIIGKTNVDDLNIDVDKLNALLGGNANLTREQAFQLREAVKQLQAARQSIADQAAATAKANELLAQNAKETDKVTTATRNLTSVFEQNYKWTDMRNRQVDRAAGLAEYAAMLDERLTKQQEKNDKAAADAKAKYTKQVENLADKLESKLSSALKAAEDNAAKANKAFADYQATISGAVSGVVNLGEAQATAAANAKALVDAKKDETDAQIALNKVLADPKADPEDIAASRQKLAEATKAVTDAEKAPLTFADALKGQVTQADTFKTNLQKVLDLGGDEALMTQLAAAGADAGNQIISGILASSDPAKTVNDLDDTLANVGAFADLIGNNAANKFYGVGVTLAQNLLTGVKDTIGDVDIDSLKKGKNAKKRLKQRTAAVDNTLGLLFGVAGVEIPEAANGGIVPARPGGTLVRVGEAGRDEAILPLPRTQQASSIVINVTAGMGADGTNIGRQIVDELVAYQRRVGALPIKVSN